jgi:hypothetical protein
MALRQADCLRGVDLTEVQHMPLHHPAVIKTLVLDDVPVAVRLAVLLSLGASQKHDATNLFAISRAWNRVGLHYSRFWPKRTTSLIANQILSQPKNRKIRVFDGESAKSG